MRFLSGSFVYHAVEGFHFFLVPLKKFYFPFMHFNFVLSLVLGKLKLREENRTPGKNSRNFALGGEVVDRSVFRDTSTPWELVQRGV